MERTDDLQEAYLTARWQQFCAGDKQAFGEIAEHYYAALSHYGTRFTHDHDLIKDCLQDLFLRIWEKRGGLSHISAVRPYLFQSLRNNLIRRIKRQSMFSDLGKEEDVFPEDVSPETDWILHESDLLTTRRLKDAIESLPKRQREALYLKYYQNLSYEEIADVMGLQRQAVANYLQYGIQKLRSYLQQVSVSLVLIAHLFV